MIAAVNGGAYGGGVELLLNCDLVIASELAQFALPEVKRGVIAAQGGAAIISIHMLLIIIKKLMLGCSVYLYSRHPTSSRDFRTSSK